MQNNSPLEAALGYLRQGISVVASDPTSKKPIYKWTELQKKLPTEQQIRAMYLEHPKAMVSIITGEISHIMVVDCDSQEAIQKVEDVLPETFEPIIAVSPRGGRHYYFSCENGKWQTKAAILPHIDIRANGGCIVAPPSRNATGGQYRWLTQLQFDPAQLQPMPDSLCQLLESAQAKPQFAIQQGEIKDLFSPGRRDNDLFHLALALRRSGESKEYILQVLINFTKSWQDNNSVKYLSEKIASAFQYEEKKDRNLAEEVKLWVNSSSGTFLSEEIKKDLQIITLEHRKNLSKILERLIEEKIIERYSNKNGCFRKLEAGIERIDWESASEEHLNIKLPLQVTDYCNINPSNIIIVAGCKDAGKSAFCLNTAVLNVNNYKINYYSNEMGDVEIKRRLKKVQIHIGTTIEILRKINFYKRLDNFADILQDEANTIHIIDYIDVTKDPYLIGESIKTIFAKLKKSVCLIALQKDYGKDLARGGASSLDKARIYLTLEGGKAKIISGKDWKNEHINPAGLVLNYSLVQGCKFIAKGEWKSTSRKYDET